MSDATQTVPDPTTTSASTAPIPTMRAGWRVGAFRGALWLRSWLTWLAFYMTPLATGWFLKQVFDALESGDSVRGWLVAIGLTEAARMVLFAVAIWFVVRWWVAALTMLRTNMLHAQTVSGGPERATLPSGPAEAISRFHNDARDAVIWSDSWLDGFGNIAFGVSALIVMASINTRAALIVLIPVGIVTLVIGWIRPRLYAASEADREATGTVNAFLGETFGGMLAFRLAAREPAVIARLERHTEARRKTAVRHVVLEQSVDGLTSTTADVSTGLILLVLVPSVRRGDITVGDMALFVTYVETLGNVPRFLSRLVTAREQAKVSLRRMGELVAADRFDDLLAFRPIDIDRGDAPVVRDVDPPRNELIQLEVTGLTARHPSTGGGISDLDLTVDGGEFVVVTGPVGSGKSTLLRALAGLIDRQHGTVRWNGETIEDLGAWFVPPNVAHLPQVPRLFSESLADNITLGRPDDLLDEVIEVTTLRTDLDEMPDGVETRVGARGLRLSGGQAQRVATARSLLTSPELLLVDDLSSALDVETERALWTHVRARGTTVVAVSHRQFVLDMADRVITLEDGYVIDGST